MSELIITPKRRAIRWQLLSTVSALALFASAYAAGEAEAADNDIDRPTVWVELGGQMEHVSGQGDPFTPGFLAANPNSPVLQPTTPLQAQRPVAFSFAEDGKISLQSEGSDWVFSVAVNYGRSSNFRNVDHQTKRAFDVHIYPTNPYLTTVENFADTQVHRRESHAILDFLAGKDVGLGLFGREGSSTLSFGIRFAQFVSKATFDVRARPDLHVNYLSFGTVKVPNKYFHTYHATGYASRSFHGIGPSLSWNGSMPFAGNSQDGEITFDWGANLALLFGRQKTRVRQHESGHYKGSGILNVQYQSVYQHSGGHSNVRSIVVPNVGSFAGISILYSDVKLSLGYRADFFFGAVDGGIDTRKSETLGFYGPFASVSVGLP